MKTITKKNHVVALTLICHGQMYLRHLHINGRYTYNSIVCVFDLCEKNIPDKIVRGQSKSAHFFSFSLSHFHSKWIMSTLPLEDRCDPYQNYHPIILSLRYSKVALGKPLVKMSPNCSTVSILTSLIPRFTISSLNQTVLMA
jgi:hypothetical protein